MPADASTRHVQTFCRICEVECGMVATVKDGELVQVRPDPEHPISQGFACPKGIAMVGIVNDPERILYPLRRKAGTPPGPAARGDFERVSWDEALSDIAARLRLARATYGSSSIGCYVGNPAYYSYSITIWAREFIAALGSPHFYGANSQDGGSRFAASAMLYGSTMMVPLPDLYNTEFLLVVGANPMVSHGCFVTAKRLEDAMREIPKRGGRIVVLDPRRTETAQMFEHIPVQPDSDAWLLLAMLQVIFEEGLEDREAIARQTRGVENLRQAAVSYRPETVEACTGVPAAAIRQLARDLAAAKRAAVYGRIGTNRGRYATLVPFLLDALAIVTGNLDRKGGLVFGTGLFSEALTRSGITYATRRTRVGGFPEAFGLMPSNVMAKEMTTPGEGQIRAFFTVAGNPVLSVPNGHELGEALAGLDLHVALDMYLTDTSCYADYILPPTSFYEREDINVGIELFHLTSFLEYTEPVIAPRGETRQEWQILEEIARRTGFVPSSSALIRALGRLGWRPSPLGIVNFLLRLGPFGDLFGLRPGGVNVAKLKKNPRWMLAEEQPTGILPKRVLHSDKLVRLDPPEIMAEINILGQRNPPDRERYPLMLVGMREIRTHNTWMHNSPKLMAGKRLHGARINPGDAARDGIADGDMIKVTSAAGSIELPAQVTAEMMPGVIAIPHGWGHGPGMSTAHEAGGANVNLLFSTRLEDIEPLAGMSLMDGVPIRIEPAARSL